MSTKPAKKETTPKQLTVIQIIKELRPLLPGVVKKLSPIEYSIDTVIEVVLNYYCHRPENRDGKNKKKEENCVPHSITVKYNSYAPQAEDTEWRHLVKFTTRTIPKRKDGTFNYDSLLVAITKARAAIQEAKDRIKKDEQQKRKRRQQYLEFLKQFTSSFADPKLKDLVENQCKHGSDSFWLRDRNGQQNWRIDLFDKNKYYAEKEPDVHFNLALMGLSPNTARKVLAVLGICNEEKDNGSNEGIESESEGQNEPIVTEGVSKEGCEEHPEESNEECNRESDGRTLHDPIPDRVGQNTEGGGTVRGEDSRTEDEAKESTEASASIQES